MKKILSIWLLSNFVVLCAQSLPLPPRSANAPKGQAFVNLITNLSREERENQIFSQIMRGNVPDFLRQMVAVEATVSIGGNQDTVRYYVTPDYLAVGADDDYFLTPMTPLLAQKLADSLGCCLPTKKMVDDIYRAATVKLRPQPIAPSAAMITVPVFAQHNDSVWSLRQLLLTQHPLGELVGGTKKDVIISNKIYNNLKPNVSKPVVIYGWHQLNGVPIQPVYNGHEETYADYSHGIRLVQNAITINGQPTTVAAVLKDATLNVLLSDEGAIPIARYGYSVAKAPTPKSFGVFSRDAQSVQVQVKPAENTTYVVYYESDGLNFPDSVIVENSRAVISNPSLANQICYVRLHAMQGNLFSDYSEVLAATPKADSPEILIVNGFDRATTSNTRNFIRQHAQSILTNGYSFNSATNDAVLDNLVSLDAYQIVDYILGEESTVDETFNSSEQELIKAFLKNGKCLLVSGSEIAWDLDYKGTTTDKQFYQQFLKAQYVMDSPNNSAGLYYRTVPVTGGIFNGLGNFYFDNGTHGSYNVQYPDVIVGANGGENCLKYGGLTDNFAAVSFAGMFPEGAKPGKVVNSGVPLETFYPDSNRAKIFARILDFFNQPAATENEPRQLHNFYLAQNCPNPFNYETIITFQLPNPTYASLKVFNLCGEEIATLVENVLAAGKYSISFTSSNLSSGIYLYRLLTPGLSQTCKMEIVK